MALKIAEIDKNFQVKHQIDRTGFTFYNVRENEAFSVHGIFYEGDCFVRMPQAIADTVNEGVARLNVHTAGGRVRFVTDSRRVAILMKMHDLGKMPHFAFTGSIGADLYETVEGEERYLYTFTPPIDVVDGFESAYTFPTEGMHELTIDLPTYSGVHELYIGLDDGAQVSAPKPYRIEKPIVFYGSSITQGGCASRPGMTYQQILSRRFDFDYINLGFSGNARGEDAIADYIAGLDMSVFVYDYDHNAPNPAHLVATHKKMFDKIRASHPDLPILCLSRPQFVYTDDVIARRDAVYATYRAAKDAGDKNVYFIEGKQLNALCGNEGSVDHCHPTDLGFFSMAQAIGEVLAKIL